MKVTLNITSYTQLKALTSALDQYVDNQRDYIANNDDVSQATQDDLQAAAKLLDALTAARLRLSGVK